MKLSGYVKSNQIKNVLLPLAETTCQLQQQIHIEIMHEAMEPEEASL